MRTKIQGGNIVGTTSKNPSILPGFTRSRQRPGERGNTMVEFAFVVVIMLTILFGIIDFGRALYTYHFISNAAREGTRYASVRGATCDNAMVTPCPITARQIRNYVKNVPLGIDVSQMNPTATFTNPNGLAVCGATRDYPGCAIQVQVSYNFKFLFPLMPSNFTMSSTSQMIITR